MKPYYILIIITGLIPGCSHNSGTDRTDSTSEKKINKQVTAVAEKYIMSQLTDAEKTAIRKRYWLHLMDDQKKYVIEPCKNFHRTDR